MSTIQLSNVFSMGTERRRPVDEYIPPVQEPYHFITFIASQVKEMFPERNICDDPAVRWAIAAPTPAPPSYAQQKTQQFSPLFAFHRKAWGRPWPRHWNAVTRDEIGRVDKGDEMYFNSGIVERFEYCCLESIKEVCTAFQAPFYLKDVLVVRQEYNRMLLMMDDSPSGLHVITGQPGIGKRAFLALLLLHRMQNRLPTAVQVDSAQYFIFDDFGATQYDAQNDSDTTRLRKCWALCDSNYQMTTPCGKILSYAQQIVLTAYPEPARWKGMCEQLGGTVLILGLPTAMEIAAVLKELGLDPSATLGHVGKWGPSLRVAIGVIEEPYRLKQHAGTVWSSDAASVTQSGLGTMPTDGGSNLLFLDRRLTESTTRRPRAVLVVPTKHLAEILDEHTRGLSNRRAFALFCTLSLHSLTPGWMHELEMHRRLMDAGEIQLFSGHDTMEVTITSNFRYGTAGILKNRHLGTPFYWVPSTPNFPGIDSVLGDANDNIFTLQATTTADHDPAEEGIRKAWDAIPRKLRENSRWHFVLVCQHPAHAISLLNFFGEQTRRLTLGPTESEVKVWACVL
ncbi:hypothetical protein B0H16DRAFT_1416959 [Mycena metata]|uniref:Lsm14-like N-terminal domain-containing protein n=1 Tax=Mycena metata TaxID=1033252 RepID=A0AAD7J5G2_9AGAR|nr:hypothetical protein B0H16DRAFT_1416959 [Mycena metata]